MNACTQFADLLPLAHAEIADSAARAALRQHLQACPACRDRRATFERVANAVGRQATRYPAPPALREAVLASLGAATAGVTPAPAAAPRPPAPSRPAWWWAGLGGGWVAAAVMASVLVLPAAPHLTAAVPEPVPAPLAFVDNHARALVTDHAIDVASSDRHTVKPWFRGRLDYAPPVFDLAPAGFPLAGGRLEVIDRQRIAVLIYQRRQHAIAVYVWPHGDAASTPPAYADAEALGYHVVLAQSGPMRIVVVSDLDRPELLALAQAYWEQLQREQLPPQRPRDRQAPAPG